MVRDLILDIAERDLSMTDKSDRSMPIFDSTWGNILEDDDKDDVLYCNIQIPSKNASSASPNANNELEIRFKASYQPSVRPFVIRLGILMHGRFMPFGTINSVAMSYLNGSNVAEKLMASQMPLVDIDGEYCAKICIHKDNYALNKAYIYSAKQTDILVDHCDTQTSHLLSICNPGNLYRYPLTGVGISKYLNSIIDNRTLTETVKLQFEQDKKSVKQIDTSIVTGEIFIDATPEKVTGHSDTTVIEQLDTTLFAQCDDNFIRRSVVINQLSDDDFLKRLKDYACIKGIYFFPSRNTTTYKLSTSSFMGEFDSDGGILPSSTYHVVTALIQAGAIAMFNDKLYDELTDAPVFYLNNQDGTRLYTSLINQPYFVSEKCYKCFVSEVPAAIKYMIKAENLESNKGLHLIPQTQANMRNLLVIVQDVNTGRLLGLVSRNTNIRDITLNEVSQYIYATQNHDD